MKHDCEGACELHSGNVKQVRLFDHKYNLGRKFDFFYCDTAIAEDRNRGFKVVSITPEDITGLEKNEIFVFGSNTEGRHGGGAAKVAMKFGAEYGNPKGFQGNTYAIITQDLAYPGQKTIGIEAIKQQIDEMLTLARTTHRTYKFLITAIGTGLAGYSFEEIASCFTIAELPDNVSLPQSIIDHLEQ